MWGGCGALRPRPFPDVYGRMRIARPAKHSNQNYLIGKPGSMRSDHLGRSLEGMRLLLFEQQTRFEKRPVGTGKRTHAQGQVANSTPSSSVA
jgi:hypothetical protein